MRVKLSSIISELESGSRPKGGKQEVGIPSIGAGELNELGSFNFSKLGFIPEEYYKSLKRGKIETNDILIVKDGATTGKVSFVDNDFPYDEAAINEHVFRIKIDNSRALPKFIFYFLFSSIGNKQILKDFRGATVGGISQGFVKLVSLKLPSLKVQKQIVEILDQADEIRKNRQNQLAKMNSLLESIFEKSFTLEKLKTKQLKQIAQVSSGITKGRKNSEPKQPIAYMRVANVQDGYLDMSEIKYIDATEKEIEKYKLEKNDLLLTEGGDPDKLGRGTLWNLEIDNCIHQNHIFRVRLNDKKILPEYLCDLIGSRYGKKYFLRIGKQTTGIATINSTQLKKFPVLLANVKKQIDYVKKRTQLKNIIDKTEKAKKLNDDLFNSVLQQAFTEN